MINNKPGFTLIEMIVAIGLVGMLSTFAATALIDIMKTQKAVNIQEAVIEDSQIIMGLLKTEIQNNTIDYEEYYNRKAHGEGFGKTHGEDFGYGSTFFIGKKGTTNEKAIECHSNGECYESFLELISPDGLTKTIYGLKKYNTYFDNDGKPINEWALSVLKLYSCEIKNNIPMNFTTEKEKCPDLIQPTESVFTEFKENPFIGDAPLMTSTRTNIVSLKFYITPANDPHKAYAMPEYTYQPKVTIILTIKPSYHYFGNSANKSNPITLQATAVPRFLGEVETYKP